MCLAIKDVRNNKIQTTYFSNAKSTLPVRMRDGTIQYFKWGRRKHEFSHLPVGCCAKLSSLKMGVWNEFFPKPIKILAGEFAVKDRLTSAIKWFEMIEGNYIQGVAVNSDDDIRIYIVSIIPPSDSIFLSWPRILTLRDVP